jgi:hypothetical protein
MSVHMTALVWDAKVERDRKLMLLAYADHADPYGNSIFPSQTTLESMTGYSLRSVKQITATLLAEELLLNVGESAYGTKEYRLNVPKLETLCGARRRGPRAGADSAPVQKTHPDRCKKQQVAGADSAPNPPKEPPSDPSKGLPEGDLFSETPIDHPELPPSMRTPELIAAWGEWKQHRKQKRQALTPLAITKQVHELAGWIVQGGPGLAVAAINHSIKSGYTGLFLPKGAAKASPPPRGPITTENALRMPTKRQP